MVAARRGFKMTERARNGLSQVVRRGKLRHRTGLGVRRFATTGFDDELLAAVDAAAAAGLPLALVVPLPAADTPIVLGAAALVAEVVRVQRLGVTATVVSKRLSQRAGYDQLYIDGQRLAELIPRARLAPDGALEIIGKPQHDTGGRMVLTSDPGRVTNSGGGLVVDGTGADPADLRGLLRGSRPVVYLTDNPFDAALDVLREAGGVVWAFDPASLTRLAAVSDSYHGDGGDALAASGALLTSAGTAERSVWAPEGDSPLDGALHAAWSALGRLAAVENRAVEYDGAHALRWAWGTLATYSLLATTPDCHDRHQRPGPRATKLADAAGQARAVAGNRSGQARDAWAAVSTAFAALHEAAGEATKLPLVQSWLDGLIEAGETGLLVTRGRASAASLTAALEESPGTRHGWRSQARVVSARDVLCGRVTELPVDSMLLTGPLPRAYASLVAAPPSTRVLTAAAGSWEATRSARQTTATVRALLKLREETRTLSAPRLGLPAAAGWARDSASGDENGAGGAEIVSIWQNGSTLAAWDLPAVDGSPWEPFHLDVLAMIGGDGRGRDTAPDLAPPVRGTGDTASVGVRAITVTFADGRYLLVEPNDLLYRRRGQENGRAAAKSLTSGDVVALVDFDARRDLFDDVVESLSELPKYQLLATLIAFWRQRVAVRDRRMTTREILKAMQTGPDPTRITTEGAVGHWFTGVSEGPNDPADVRRFAVAVGDKELERRAEAVGTALRTSRVVNRRVGKWLSAQITGARLSDEDVVVDPDLGVHVADLLEAVSLHRVAGVSATVATVPAGAVGMLHEAHTAPAGAPLPVNVATG
jgi:hypothetical protein